MDNTNNNLQNATNTIEQSFVESFAGNLDSINQELLDTAYNLLTNDTLAQNLPFVGSIKGLANVGIAIRDYIFAKKAIGFLIISKEIDEEKRKKFTEKILTNKNYRTSLGETYIEFIEKAQNIENAEQIAYLSNACINGHISYEDFLRCSRIVLTISCNSIRDFVTLEEIPEESLDELLYSGLYRISVTPTSIQVKDAEQIKAEAEQKKHSINFMPNFGMPYIDYPQLLDQINGAVSLGDNTPTLSSLLHGTPEKYHVNTSGGQIEISLSRVGEIIKENLAGFYKK